ncbi:hypothetical protein GCM10009605_59090 [Nocardiopsis composta]
MDIGTRRKARSRGGPWNAAGLTPAHAGSSPPQRPAGRGSDRGGSTRGHVRQALARLLDYAAHTDRPVDRVWGLFPHEPAADLVGLLHRYGIGCIYRAAPEQFVHLPPPEKNQGLIVQFW